ncbi:hypothetical protein RHSIM_Rhsim09G0081800 [Rhododendron simsii]|uniref:Uncharacterized protein n=1 Tax=Rhododendron simsii TaxID=118357 RepID=A0A834GEF2_RHOSS|nr:hypothetical protein RHSIM_Rhsim09G0081800 [Rhododendron simsii]
MLGLSIVWIGGIFSPRVAKVGQRCPPPKKKAKGIAPAIDTGKSKGNPSRLPPWNALSSMGLFSGASIFDTIVDDYDLHWDLASLDDDFNFNEMWIVMLTKLLIACIKEIIDNNQGFHAFPTPPKGVEEMVPDTSSLQAPPSSPPLSTSGMGYSIDYQPLSSYVLNVASRQPIIRASVGNGIQDGDQIASPLPAHSPQLDGQLEKQLAVLLLGGLVMCLSRNKVCNDEQARCNILGSAYFAFKC